MNGPRSSLRGIAVTAVAILAVALVIVFQNRDSKPVPPVVGGGNNGGGNQVSVATEPSASSTAALPGKVAQSDLQAAQDVARRYVVAAHTVDYRTVDTKSWLDNAQPYMTPGYYRRAAARTPRPGDVSGSDKAYLEQLKSSSTQVSVHVSSVAVASGDGGAVTAGGFSMRAYFVLHTVTEDNFGGVTSQEMPSTLKMVKTSGKWLVAGADGG